MSSYLQEKAFGLLATGVAGMQTADGKSTIYTVPTAKKAIVVAVIIRNPTDSLAGGTSFAFGDGANADTRKTAVDLSALTATTDGKVIWDDGAKKTVLDAGDAFGVKATTGSTADANATIAVFGYEWDA
jgi:hypothetical protein